MEFRPEIESLRYEEYPEVASSNIKPTYQFGAYGANFAKTFDPSNPEPFRADSPYQQLVDVRTVHDSLLSRYRGSTKETNTEEKKILCYLTNWSFYRVNDGKFVPELLNSKLCTHIIYSFGSLDPTTLTVKEFDKWADIDNDLYRRTTSLSKDVPVLLAIGGWTDSTGDKYSRLVSDSSARRTFIRQLIPYLQKYGFKGVHFDWNYPRYFILNGILKNTIILIIFFQMLAK